MGAKPSKPHPFDPRLAKQTARNPSALEPTATDNIHRRAAGLIDTGAMMKALTTCTYVPGAYDPTGGDGYIRGSWRQIEDALVSGLITDEEYEQIAREAPTSRATRATR